MLQDRLAPDYRYLVRVSETDAAVQALRDCAARKQAGGSSRARIVVFCGLIALLATIALPLLAFAQSAH